MREQATRTVNRFYKYQMRRKAQAKAMIFACVFVICFMFALFFGLNLSIQANAQEEHKLVEYFTTYTVSYGDTVSEIAVEYYNLYDNKQYYYTYDSYYKLVCRMNSLDQEGSILKGQLLILPYALEESF